MSKLISGLLVLAAIQSLAQGAQTRLPHVNYEKLISGAALTYNEPVSRSEEGMPVGNGSMGSLVWTTPSAIRLQVNRVDVFANNSNSNNFYERHTDYCGGVGIVDVDFFNETTFTKANFRQHLSPYDGVVSLEGNQVSARVLAWNEQDVIALEVQDNRPDRQLTNIKLRTLRPLVSKKGNHTATSALKIIDGKIVLTQTFREDQYYCASAVAIEVLDGQGVPSLENATTLRLLVSAGNSRFSVLIASAATFDSEEDVVAESLNKLDAAAAQRFDGLLTSNKAWWKNFWEKSFIDLSSDDGKASLLQDNYYYYLYVMACSSRGAYPPKFNGMLWITGGDERKWGSLYWGANQSCLYNALFPTNRFELMRPMFNMYSSMKKVCELAAVQQWGSKGIYIPETVAFDGLAPLPDDVAAEMRDLYLVRKPWAERTQRFSAYAFTKMPYLSRWNWKKDEGWKDGRWHSSDKGGGPFGHVTHIFSRGAKIAYQYWLAYEYTLDKEWLRDEAYPMIKGVAEFYRNFPNVRKADDGKFHIYNVNDNESVWGGHNTIEEISSMMGILPVAIKASELLNKDADLRQQWRELLENLSPLPTSADVPGDGNSNVLTWARALPPMVQGNGNRLPDPNTLPVWFFDLATLESDPETLRIANATFDGYFPAGIGKGTRVNVLSKLPVAGSLLGRESTTRFLIANQIETEEVKPLMNRMDLREGFQTTSVQRLGRAAEALHYALCQSVPPAPGKDPVIRVFPAWPREWNARFSLLCRGGFLVTSSLNNKEIAFVDITAQSGSECRLRNPWPGIEVTIYRNGKRWKDSKKDLLHFEAKAGDHFMILEKDSKPPGQ
jgi:hypothetical protein